LAQAVEQVFPDAAVECRDLLQDVPRWLRRAYPATYYLLVRHFPTLWGWCFELVDHPWVYAVIQPIRRLWNRFATRGFIRSLRQQPPDLIITTHFFPTDVVSACKEAGWLRSPLVVAVTDLYPHRFWLASSAEAYVFGTAEGARAIERWGLSPHCAHVLGIPIARGFSAVYDRRRLEQLFQLAPGRAVILVTSGGRTVGRFEQVVHALINLERVLPGRLQLLVVCGDDPRAVRRLQARAQQAAMPVRVFGFIETMPEAMAASDLIVAKAGGLTVTEALARGIPLVLYHVIPGQEGLNAQHVVGHGAGLIAPTPQRAAEAVRQLFEEPGRLEAMRKAAAALSHPEAASEIMRRVAKPLLMPSSGSDV